MHAERERNMASPNTVKAVSTQTADRDPVYKAASHEMKALRNTLEQSTGKWSLNKSNSGISFNHKVK